MVIDEMFQTPAQCEDRSIKYSGLYGTDLLLKTLVAAAAEAVLVVLRLLVVVVVVVVVVIAGFCASIFSAANDVDRFLSNTDAKRSLHVGESALHGPAHAGNAWWQPGAAGVSTCLGRERKKMIIMLVGMNVFFFFFFLIPNPLLVRINVCFSRKVDVLL